MSREDDALVVCEQCAMPHRWRALAPGMLARCVRCEAVLGRGHRLSIDAVLALTVTAAVLFLVALGSDVLTLQLRGSADAATLPQAIAEAWRQGEQMVAIVAALTAIVAPALFIGLRLYLLVPLAAGKKARGFAWCVRLLHLAGRWNMVEVFTIGVLLSLVRLASLADAAPGPGLFALGAVTLLFAAIESAGLRHLWWQIR